MKEATSNSWLLMSLLVIFFFIYQWIEIYTIVTMSCTPLENFWLAPDQLGFNPFKAFIIVFVLFGIWALVEILAAQISGYSDKWFCTITCSLSLVCVIATIISFRMQWEYYEIQWGLRSYKNFTFEIIDMPEKMYINPWSEFMDKKRCEDPNFFRKLDSEEEWLKLEKEFLDGGGSFERIEIGS